LKYKLVHKIISLVTVLILLTPFAVQSIHGINSEVHPFCDSKDLKHLHHNDADCSVYHLNIQQVFLLDSDNFSLEKIAEISEEKCTKYYREYYFLSAHKSPRAPPYFNVF
jgi:hypothetical protein